MQEKNNTQHNNQDKENKTQYNNQYKENNTQYNDQDQKINTKENRDQNTNHTMNKKIDLRSFRRDDLLLVGGLIWVIFGSIMIFIGYRQMMLQVRWVLVYFLIAVAVFYGTFIYIFKRLTQKYTDRIKNKKEERLAVWKVFNIEGYLVVTVIIIGGFYIDTLEGLNPIWWAPVYIGLGLTLIVSGAMYWIGYMKNRLSFRIKK